MNRTPPRRQTPTPPPEYKSGSYDNSELVELYEETRALHEKSLAILRTHEERCKLPGGTLEDLTDTVWLIRKTSERAEDLRKMLDRLEKEFVKRIGIRWLARADAEPIRGALATGSPDVKDVPRTPSRSKNPGAYAAALEALGVPRILAENGAVVFHYQGLGEFSAALAKKGLNIPKALLAEGEPYIEHTLRLTQAKENPFI